MTAPRRASITTTPIASPTITPVESLEELVLLVEELPELSDAVLETVEDDVVDVLALIVLLAPSDNDVVMLEVIIVDETECEEAGDEVTNDGANGFEEGGSVFAGDSLAA